MKGWIDFILRRGWEGQEHPVTFPLHVLPRDIVKVGNRMRTADKSETILDREALDRWFDEGGPSLSVITDILLDTMEDPILELRSGEMMPLSQAQKEFPPETDVRIPDPKAPGHKWFKLSYYRRPDDD